MLMLNICAGQIDHANDLNKKSKFFEVKLDDHKNNIFPNLLELVSKCNSGM